MKLNLKQTIENILSINFNNPIKVSFSNKTISIFLIQTPVLIGLLDIICLHIPLPIQYTHLLEL